jgi:enamine deaminase RidA (YjgF/YER057c/UK114 family)
VAVFGEDIGIPARAAVGVAELRLQAAVETEMIVAVRH